MPSRKSDIREVSRTAPTAEEQAALHAQLRSKAHPIVTAMLGAASVEHQLDEILRPRFKRRDNATWAKLTNDNGPLNSLNQKIQAAYAFGIADETVVAAMNTIRDIRNCFAHSRKPITFNERAVKDKLRGISLPANHRSKLFRDLNRVRNLQKTDPEGAFITLCYVAMNVLLKHQLRVTRGMLRRRESKLSPLARALLGARPEGIAAAGLPPLGSLPGSGSMSLGQLPGFFGSLRPRPPHDDNSGK